MGPSPTQILIVIGIIVLLFGAGRLATVGKGLGEGIRNFRKGLSSDDDEDAPELGAEGESEADEQQV